MEQLNEAVEIHTGAEPQQGGKRLKKGGKWPLAIFCALIALAAAAYLGLCVWVEYYHPVIWEETYVMGQDLGGMTVEEAAAHLEQILPELTLQVYLCDVSGESAAPETEPAAIVKPVADLGLEIDAREMARVAEHSRHVWENPVLTFLTAGWRYLQGGARYELFGEDVLVLDEDTVEQTAKAIASGLSFLPEGTAYRLGDNAVEITRARNGRSVAARELEQLLAAADWQQELTITLPCRTLEAKVLTAQQIHDATAGELKNAAYDKETGTISPDSMGVAFNAALAQKKLDEAQPGETVKIPAQIEYPTVTGAHLKEVLFRDVLGEARTHVSGTAARINNVKLSAATINGYVMNSGDVFSYNEAVGQRTAANGYQPAPAYIKGETVDEIGGGICQTSSTLYLACLLGDLEITERYAHRYVPAYIPWGMDATVSWGGPDYKFTNQYEYPIKIVTEYSKNYLTVKILGTNTDGRYAKMTNEVLSTTPWETVYEEDPLLPAGTPETEKTSPYTGYKVKAYHTLYDKDGNVVDSHVESVSDYKVRNKVIVRPPAPVVTPEGELAELPQEGTAEAPAGTPGEAPPETPETPEVPGDVFWSEEGAL